MAQDKGSDILIVDGHEDLAWNMLTYGRDYTRSVVETREIEAQAARPHAPDEALLGWPEYQRGRVSVIFATLFVSPARRKVGDWDIQSYTDTNEANRLYRAQVDLYNRLVEEHPAQFRLIKTRPELEVLLRVWQESEPQRDTEANSDEEQSANTISEGNPVGLVILMEGAEGVRTPAELEEWWQMGVRLIGPAWAGTRFCGGTREPGPLTREGYALLEAMASFGFTLDISHMDEKAVLQALDFYPGPIVATHANALSLLRGSDSNRHLSDRVIQGLLEREGIIGILPANSSLLFGWKRGDSRKLVSLQKVVDQIDTICQMAGDAQHVAIGSDFDGGFGIQSVPDGIDSIADLRKLIPLLSERGYTDDAIAAVLGANWLRHLNSSLPESL